MTLSVESRSNIEICYLMYYLGIYPLYSQFSIKHGYLRLSQYTVPRSCCAVSLHNALFLRKPSALACFPLCASSAYISLLIQYLVFIIDDVFSLLCLYLFQSPFFINEVKETYQYNSKEGTNRQADTIFAGAVKDGSWRLRSSS